MIDFEQNKSHSLLLVVEHATLELFSFIYTGGIIWLHFKSFDLQIIFHCYNMIQEFHLNLNRNKSARCSNNVHLGQRKGEAKTLLTTTPHKKSFP